MQDKNLEYIINTVKSHGEQYFSTGDNEANNSATLHGSAVSTRKGSKTEDQTCVFKEVPPFILALLNELAKNLLEHQRNTINDLKQEYENKLKDRDSTIKDLKSEIRTLRNDHDALGTYNRRENLKIQGVAYNENENTNEIVKEICKYAGREITDADISTSHRNGSVTTAPSSQPGMTSTRREIPVIYVRFTRRDVKTEVFEKRKNLSTNASCPVKYRNIAIYEDVTPLRSRIMYELRQRNEKKEFRYLWSRGGRIFCKTPEQVDMSPSARPYVINKPEDLVKVGFSEEEIKTIILNKRD